MIGQLIKITTVPIAIEMKIENAKFERQNKTAEIEISKNQGGLQMKSRPLKVKLDSFDSRNDLVPTAMKSVEQAARKGIQASYTATSKMSQNGKMYLEGQIGEDVTGKIIEQENAPHDVNVSTRTWPANGQGVKTKVDMGELKMVYDMDKLKFDVKQGRGDFEFIPASIDVEITQYPDVHIEYLGGPIYVPPREEE